MEILGIGPLELLFILLIALIAVGPRDLGKAARSTGRLLNQLYKSEAWQNLSEASRSIRTLPNRLAREAALEELQQVKQEMEAGVAEGVDQLRQTEQNLTETLDPQNQSSESQLDPSRQTDESDSGDVDREPQTASETDEDPSPESN